jgi:AcrR family transcriptional regulator
MVYMTKKRLSRADSRARTAQRLLDAAERLIARRGLDATSVEDIAEAAGFSRGAFYSNFESKEAVFLEVLRRDQERTYSNFAGVLDEALPLEQVQARIREIYTTLYDNTNSFMTWTEARMLSARDAKFRVKLAALIAERRDFAVEVIEYLHKRAGRTPSLPLEPMAMGLISLIQGLRLVVASCLNEMPRDVAQSILCLFVDSAFLSVAPGTAAGPTRAR